MYHSTSPTTPLASKTNLMYGIAGLVIGGVATFMVTYSATSPSLSHDAGLQSTLAVSDARQDLPSTAGSFAPSYGSTLNAMYSTYPKVNEGKTCPSPSPMPSPSSAPPPARKGNCDLANVTVSRIERGIPKAYRTKFHFQGHSFQMAVHPGSDWVSKSVKEKGYYGNLGVVSTAAKRVKDSGRELGLFVDAGTNIGVFTFFAHRVGFKHIISFEPTAINMARVQETVAINQIQYISAYKAALGNENTCVDMAVDWSTRMTNLGMNQIVSGRNKATAKSIEHVRMTRMDDIVPTDAGPVQFLKMDIEGSECDGLRGARDLFAAGRVEQVFVEVNPEALKALGCSADGLGKVLEALCMDVSKYVWDRKDAGDFNTYRVPGCVVRPRDQLP